MNKKNILTVLALASVLLVTSCSEDAKPKADGTTPVISPENGGDKKPGETVDTEAAKLAAAEKAAALPVSCAEVKKAESNKWVLNYETVCKVLKKSSEYTKLDGSKEMIAALKNLAEFKKIVESYNGGNPIAFPVAAKDLKAIYDAQSVLPWSATETVDGSGATSGGDTYRSIEEKFYTALLTAVKDQADLGLEAYTPEDCQEFYTANIVSALADSTAQSTLLGNGPLMADFARIVKRMAAEGKYVSDEGFGKDMPFDTNGKLVWDMTNGSTIISVYVEAVAISMLFDKSIIEEKYLAIKDITTPEKAITEFKKWKTTIADTKVITSSDSSKKDDATIKNLLTRFFLLLDLLTTAANNGITGKETTVADGQRLDNAVLIAYAYSTPCATLAEVKAIDDAAVSDVRNLVDNTMFVPANKAILIKYFARKNKEIKYISTHASTFIVPTQVADNLSLETAKLS